MAKDNSDYLQRPVLSNIIYLGGSAGAGKTSVVGKFLADSLKEKELYISAPT
jgi:tRNA A37 threonylcarbamoyladenosine biosynthesis protein TsaE